MVTDGFDVRRVVVGRGEDAGPTILSDAPPPLTIASPTGVGVSELLSSAGPLTSVDAGGDPPREAVGAFPEDGGVAARLIRFPATNEWVRIAGDDPEQPGMHRSQTLDLMVVLSGRIVLGVEDGEAEVGAGDAVVQRGTLHRWRVPGEERCTYLSVLLAPFDGAAVPSPPLPTLSADPGPRLFVTGTGQHGSMIEATGTSAPDECGRRAWWDTDGPVRAVNQGSIGSAAGHGGTDGKARIAGAVSLTMIDLAIAGSAGHTTTTDSIDLVVVRSGTVTAALDATAGVSSSHFAAVTETTTSQPHVQFDKLSLSAGDVLVTRGIALRLTSTAADLAVVSFTPAES